MRPVLRRALAGAALLLAVPLAGCSHPASRASSAVSTATAVGTDLPVVVTPIDTGAPVRYDPDATKAVRRNEIGEPWTLDAPAATACAHAEFAFRAPETGGSITQQVAALRKTAAGTKSKALLAAVAALPAAPSAAQVQPVLQVCTAMGYQL